MAFVSLLAAALSPPPPPCARNFSPRRRSQVGLRLSPKSLQATISVEHSKVIDRISRRDALLASIILLSNLIASDAAEASRIKPETRRKIREKLEKLREKGEVTKDKKDSKSGNGEQELPKRLNRLGVPLVEATMG